MGAFADHKRGDRKLFYERSIFLRSNMPFQEADHLPSYEELETTELNMTAAPLRAGAHHLGRYCDNQSKEFMLCMKEENDPRKCIYEGKEVTRCGVEFFQKMKAHCAEEFTAHWNCVDHAGIDMNLTYCRKTQAAFDKCVFDTLGQERPELGYFSRIRVHETTRPKPKRDVPFPEPTPEPPNPKEMPIPDSAKHGTRFVFFK